MRPGFDNASLPAPTFHEVLKALETDSAVCYVLDSKLNITYTNPAWDQFASDNDGSDLTAAAVNGTNIFEVIPRILRPFYTRVSMRCEAEPRSGSTSISVQVRTASASFGCAFIY